MLDQLYDHGATSASHPNIKLKSAQVANEGQEKGVVSAYNSGRVLRRDPENTGHLGVKDLLTPELSFIQ